MMAGINCDERKISDRRHRFFWRQDSDRSGRGANFNDRLSFLSLDRTGGAKHYPPCTIVILPARKIRHRMAPRGAALNCAAPGKGTAANVTAKPQDCAIFTWRDAAEYATPVPAKILSRRNILLVVDQTGSNEIAGRPVVQGARAQSRPSMSAPETRAAPVAGAAP